MDESHVSTGSEPDPDLIYDLMYDDWKTHVLKIAIQLDVFTAIAEGSDTLEKMVSEKGWTRKPTRLLLDALCFLGLLTKEGGAYILTPTSEALLVTGSENYAGDSLKAFFDCSMWEQLLEAIKKGVQSRPSLQNACDREWVTLWKQDAAMESMRTSQIPVSLKMWQEAGIDVDSVCPMRIMDLASGCAIKSLALALHNPKFEIMCVDWAEVLEVAARLSERLGVSERVDMKAGDVMVMDFGDSQFDAVFLGQITYYLSPEQNVSVLKRVHRSLKPGGDSCLARTSAG